MLKFTAQKLAKMVIFLIIHEQNHLRHLCWRCKFQVSAASQTLQPMTVDITSHTCVQVDISRT
jgi:hypothetical protein